MKNNLLKITGFKLGLLITFLITILYFSNVKFLNLIELKALDLRFLQRGKVDPKSPVIIVGVDDKSIKKMGRWPWSRSYMADLVDFMTDADAKVVGFDITFAEPDSNSDLMLLSDIDRQYAEWNIKSKDFYTYIQNRKKLADNDQRLAESLKRNGRIILGYFFHTEETEKRLDDETREEMTKKLDYIAPSKLSAIFYTSEKAQEFEFIEFSAADVNIKKISDATQGFGFFNIFPDVDGTIRWSPLVLKYHGELFPPLNLQILREYLREEGEESENIVVKVNELGVYEVRLYDYIIPTDRFGRAMINFRGPAYTFKYYSFVDIINGDVPKEIFKDKIVLVGVTSIGIYDMRVTPFTSVYPGVEVHANVIDNILNRDPLVSPDWVRGVDFLSILLLGLLISYMIPKYKASNSAAAILLLLISYVTVNFTIFNSGHIWLNLVYPVFTIALNSLLLYTYRFATEEREKKRIRGAFSHYVTEAVVSDMLKNPDKLKLGGEKKDLTVLFSDIRGFTSISEGLQPAELVHLLNEYLTAMTRIVFKYEGTLDKYMGDAIMAIYGAPLDQPDHPLKACLTAIDMMRVLKKMQVVWKKNNVPKINIGIGINTGAMSVGNMGSEVRFDYTVMGDNVNLGSRLEGINKQYGTNIIISEFTLGCVKDDLICRQLDRVRVKGKNQPVKIYHLIANKRGPDRRELQKKAEIKKFGFIKTKDKYQSLRSGEERRKLNAEDLENLASGFEAALAKYFEMDFVSSLQMFKEIEQEFPEDKPTKLFLQRVQNLIDAPPPPDWDGVFIMTTK